MDKPFEEKTLFLLLLRLNFPVESFNRLSDSWDSLAGELFGRDFFAWNCFAWDSIAWVFFAWDLQWNLFDSVCV